MQKTFIVGCILLLALTAPAQERHMVSVQDALWNAQSGLRSIPVQRSGPLSVGDAVLPVPRLDETSERHMVSPQDALWNSQVGAMTVEQPVTRAPQAQADGLRPAYAAYPAPRYFDPAVDGDPYAGIYPQPLYAPYTPPVQPDFNRIPITVIRNPGLTRETQVQGATFSAPPARPTAPPQPAVAPRSPKTPNAQIVRMDPAPAADQNSTPPQAAQRAAEERYLAALAQNTHNARQDVLRSLWLLTAYGIVVTFVGVRYLVKPHVKP
jgi:hypothetical protein